MYKVLLIDDEPLIRRGLRLLIDWGIYNFDICGEASNGMEGLECIETLKPDLVVVDIKMPAMDGLSMIEEVKRRGVECHIIILTGYPEFEYAQKAVEFGVDTYILKPIDENMLTEKVAKAYEEISRNRDLKKSFNESVQYSRERIIENMVLGQMNDEKLQKLNDVYSLNLPWNSYQVILLCPEDSAKSGRELLSKIKTIIHEYVGKNSIGHIFCIENKIGILLKDEVMSGDNYNLTLIRSNVKKALQTDILTALGKSVKQMVEIPFSYRHACGLLEKNFIYGFKGVIADDIFEHADNILAASGHTEDEILESLYAAIDVNSMGVINDMLGEKMHILAVSGFQEEYIKTSYIDMYMKLLNRIMMKNEGFNDLFDKNNIFIAEVYNKKSLIELNAYIKFKLISISDELCRTRPENVMSKIIDYLNRNYSNDIKLDTLAQLFNYSSAYLGQLFKNHTGEYFNTFMDKLRIDKAKLLLSKGLKVYQVAQRVGYNDTDYFVEKFKKYEGIPPSAYKILK